MVPFRGGLVRFTQFYFADSHRYGEIVRAAVVSKLTLTEVVEEYDVSWVVSLPADTWPEFVLRVVLLVIETLLMLFVVPACDWLVHSL